MIWIKSPDKEIDNEKIIRYLNQVRGSKSITPVKIFTIIQKLKATKWHDLINSRRWNPSMK